VCLKNRRRAGHGNRDGSGLIPSIETLAIGTLGREGGSGSAVTLIQHSNGIPYGDTAVGGLGCINSFGVVVFLSVKVRFQPFVTFLPPRSAADIGNTIQMFGQGSDGTEKMIFRTAVEEIIVRPDAEKKNLEFTIHSKGGANTQLAAP
jgi:hypothetical protein